jgi:hypothetical protein
VRSCCPIIGGVPPYRSRSTAASSQSRKIGPDFFNRITCFLTNLSQLRVFGFGLLEDGDVRVGVYLTSITSWSE